MKTTCWHCNFGLCIITMNTCWCEDGMGCPIEKENDAKYKAELGNKYTKK